MRAVTTASKSFYSFVASFCAMIASLTDSLNRARAQDARFSGTHW